MSPRRRGRSLLAAGAAVLLVGAACTLDDPPADEPESTEAAEADTAATGETTTEPSETYEAVERDFLEGVSGQDVEIDAAAAPTTVEVGHGICVRLDSGEPRERIAEKIEPFAQSLQPAGEDSPSPREIADILIAESERTLCA